MINIDTLYNLYVYSINMRIRRSEDQIKLYGEKVNAFMPQLEYYRDTLNRHIDYHALLNGYVKELPTDVMLTADRNLKFINIIVKEYYSIRAPMNMLADDIKRLSSNKISVKIYKEVIRKCNNKIGDWLIKTGGTFNDPYFGAITLKHLESVNRINWGVSNKKKKEILDRGGILYVKEDEELCNSKGIPYFGEKWLSKDYPNGVLAVFWQLNTFVKKHFHDSITVKYVATKGNYGIVKKLSDCYLIGVDYSIYKKVKNETNK